MRRDHTAGVGRFCRRPERMMCQIPSHKSYPNTAIAIDNNRMREEAGGPEIDEWLRQVVHNALTLPAKQALCHEWL
jgi:hypothetical protein